MTNADMTEHGWDDGLRFGRENPEHLRA